MIREQLRLDSSEIYKLIIMDYNMPEMNGPEVVGLINLIYDAVIDVNFKRPNIVCNTSETSTYNI